MRHRTNREPFVDGRRTIRCLGQDSKAGSSLGADRAGTNGVSFLSSNCAEAVTLTIVISESWQIP
jgi:hypothetical protein